MSSHTAANAALIRDIAKAAKYLDAAADNRAVEKAVAVLVEDFVASGKMMVPKHEAEVILHEFSRSGVSSATLKRAIERAAVARGITIEFS